MDVKDSWGFGRGSSVYHTKDTYRQAPHEQVQVAPDPVCFKESQRLHDLESLIRTVSNQVRQIQLEKTEELRLLKKLDDNFTLQQSERAFGGSRHANIYQDEKINEPIPQTSFRGEHRDFKDKYLSFEKLIVATLIAMVVGFTVILIVLLNSQKSIDKSCEAMQKKCEMLQNQQELNFKLLLLKQSLQK